MPAGAYILWTERGLSCRLGRTAQGWQVSVAAPRRAPFLRRFAHSKGDAANQAEFLRVLLDRSRAGGRGPRERQPLILIVEDDAESLRTYEEMLKCEGLRTASAPSLAEARRLMRAITPSAVLLAHVLPDGDGPMFARELRQSGTGAAIPIVLVPGLAPASASPAYDDCPDAILGKPCRPETLTGVVKLLLQRAAPVKARGRGAGAAAPLVRARCP